MNSLKDNPVRMRLRSDRALVRAGACSTRHLVVSLIAPAAPDTEGRPPIHLGVVLDRSGSMDGERKFALATQAVERALRMLQPRDRFTLVVYDTEVDVVMESVAATEEAKQTALRRLVEVAPRGGTDLYAGWMTGAAQLSRGIANECVNRIVLLTDGLANHGVSEPSALTAAAAELRRRGVATTTYGVGADFDEQLLRDIAHDGGGRSYFIETPVQIGDLLASELGETLTIVRRGAVLEVALPPGARGELLNHYRSSFADGGNSLRVELGDLTADERLSLVVRIVFPVDREAAMATARATFKSSASAVPECEGAVQWVYADHAANDTQSRDTAVDRDVAAVYAARARAQATHANRQGDLARARQVLQATARRIRGYASGDEVLEALWQALMEEAERYSERQFSPMEQKRAFYLAETQLRNRDHEGKARK